MDLCDPWNVASLCIACLTLGAAIGGLAGAAIVWDIKRIVIHTPSDHSEAP